MKNLCVLALLLADVITGLPAAPGTRILEYLHARGEALNLTWPQPIRGIYIDWRDASPIDVAVKNAADQGFNAIMLAFLVSSTSADAADAWSILDSATQTAAVTYAHSKGAIVLLSAGGSTDFPYSTDPVSYGRAAGAWAVNNGLDGVDFDFENFAWGMTYPTAGLNASEVINWIVAASTAARAVLGSGNCGGFISHAPQGPYFAPIGPSSSAYFAGALGGYTAVFNALMSASPPAIDWLFVQYYNQNANCYTNYTGLFLDSSSGDSTGPCWTPENAVSQLNTSGVPFPQVIVGKPLLPSDADNGWVDPTTLGEWFGWARSSLGYNGGVFAWSYSFTNGTAWLEAIYPAAQRGTAASAVGPQVGAVTCESQTSSVTPSGTGTRTSSQTPSATRTSSTSMSSSRSSTNTATFSHGASQSSSVSRTSTAAQTTTATTTGSTSFSPSQTPSASLTNTATYTALPLSPDGSCGASSAGPYRCGSGYCCGQYGYCGSTTAYCGNGCQHIYGICFTQTATVGFTGTYSSTMTSTGYLTSPNGSCGPSSAGPYRCTAGFCCGQYGYCGSTSDYCGSGCQTLFGICLSATATSSSSSTATGTTTISRTSTLTVSSSSSRTSTLSISPSRLSTLTRASSSTASSAPTKSRSSTNPFTSTSAAAATSSKTKTASQAVSRTKTGTASMSHTHTHTHT